MSKMSELGNLEFCSYADILKQNSSRGYSQSLDRENLIHDFDLEELQETPKNWKYQNVVFDISVLNYTRDYFFKHLALISNPMLLIYGSLVDELDKVNHKESIYTDYQRRYAKSLLKFIAADEENKYSNACSEHFESSKDLVKFAKRFKAIIITNNVLTIFFAKLNKVKYRVLKEVIESPFDSESKLICGIDTSIISHSIEDLRLMFSPFKGISICDVTLYELEKVINGEFSTNEKESAKFILACIAYFGTVQFSRQRLSNADKSIVNFYKENQVNLVMSGKFKAVLTADSGFAAYSRCENVPYVLCLNNQSSNSEFTEFMENQFDFEEYIQDDHFYFHSLVNSANSTYIEINTYMLLLRRVIIQVFSQNQVLKEVTESIVRIYPEDVVVLRNADNVIILRFSDAKEAKGKIWFAGLVENLPEKYKKFLV